MLANATSYLSKQFSGQPLASFDVTAEKDLNRNIYGIICFSIIFSFVGTVLGGLWADDSWGRFWAGIPRKTAR